MIHDDLTKHADAYRELSLPMGRPPGREAFPGDFFFIHAELLERAAARRPDAGGGPVTALPVVETTEGDIGARGLRGFLLGYFRPNALFAPLYVISELSRTLALSVRLFGNMMSGHLIVVLLVSLTGFLVPMPLMALEVLIGLLQAYIFAVLTTVYLGAAIRVGEGRKPDL